MERSKLTDFTGIITFLGFIEHDFALENTLKKPYSSIRTYFLYPTLIDYELEIYITLQLMRTQP